MTAPGTVYFDYISLLPEAGWRGQPNGLRPDLAEMIAQLSPSFVRFPGGTIVCGREQAWRWPVTIGDPARRRGHQNNWGYYNSAGFGFLEHLCLCESLGAEPLFVVCAGIDPHEQALPGAELEPFIAEALAAVEYANGALDTPGGALRAAHGHPAPFHLRYLEIGNEHTGPAYAEHFRRFYQAIKARYPEITVISTHTEITNSPVDIRDEHYFDTQEGLARRGGTFDGYDRQGPKIYIGEYACIDDFGCVGNLQSALAEAAFMTGLERNGDLVVMASYAPLFVNVRDRQWEVDAIGFDQFRCYGTPSYYVQQLFSRHRCDRMLVGALAGDLDNPLAFTWSAGYALGSQDFILKCVNRSDAPRPLTIRLPDTCRVNTGTLWTLTAESPDRTNDLRHPTHVVPRASTLAPRGQEMAVTCPPWSLIVLHVTQPRQSKPTTDEAAIHKIKHI